MREIRLNSRLPWSPVMLAGTRPNSMTSCWSTESLRSWRTRCTTTLMAISHRMAGGRLIARSPAPRCGPERLRLSKGMRQDLALQPPRAQPEKKAAQQKGRRAADEAHHAVLAERLAVADRQNAAQGQEQDDAARYGEEPAEPTAGRRHGRRATRRRWRRCGRWIAHRARSAVSRALPAAPGR